MMLKKISNRRYVDISAWRSQYLSLGRYIPFGAVQYDLHCRIRMI